MSFYDVTCLKLNLNFNHLICFQFLEKESFENEVNNDENAKLSQQILVFYFWQIIDMTWIIIMKFNVLKDDLIVNNIKLEKTITVLTSVVLMIKLRVRNDLSDFHKLTLIVILLITMRIWKVEIQQYFLKLMIQYFMSFFEKSFIEKKNHMLDVSIFYSRPSDEHITLSTLLDNDCLDTLIHHMLLDQFII